MLIPPGVPTVGLLLLRVPMLVAVGVVAGPTGTRLVVATPFAGRHQIFQRLLALIELFLPLMFIFTEVGFLVIPVTPVFVLISTTFTVEVPPLVNVLLPDTHRSKSPPFPVIGPRPVPLVRIRVQIAMVLFYSFVILIFRRTKRLLIGIFVEFGFILVVLGEEAGIVGDVGAFASGERYVGRDLIMHQTTRPIPTPTTQIHARQIRQLPPHLPLLLLHHQHLLHRLYRIRCLKLPLLLHAGNRAFRRV